MTIRVERKHLGDVVLLIGFVIAIEIIAKMVDGRYSSPYALFAFWGWMIFQIASGRAMGKTERITVNFNNKSMVLLYPRKKRELLYDDILEVRKIMVMNAYQYEKGLYRVIVRTKWKKYKFYTPDEERHEKLNFEETDLGAFYQECSLHGVNCN